MNLDKELDIVKTKSFLGSNAGFLGPILCKTVIKFSKEIPTACAEPKRILINPEFFQKCSREERIFVLLHELWHIARLHHIRGEGKNHEIFNIACDAVINRDLKKDCQNFSYSTYKLHSEAILIPEYDDLSEEEIYNKLIKRLPKDLPKGLNGDLSSKVSQEDKQEIINTVISAATQCNINNAGDIPGSLKSYLDSFLKPKLDWKPLLERYLTEISNYDLSWIRPNRRYQNIYLPGKVPDEGQLEHLAFFIDTSGSVTDEQIARYVSEIKYIKETFNPEKLTIIQFDYRIRSIKEYSSSDYIKSIEAVGRGGTSLEEVHDWIQKNKPTCSVIFSDLECSPMEKVLTPVIWIVVDSEIEPNFGKVIHITS